MKRQRVKTREKTRENGNRREEFERGRGLQEGGRETFEDEGIRNR